MKQKTELSYVRCQKCPEKAEEIIHAGENKRVGWWCRACGYFEKAILRERKVA